jgi:hypothetical protein
VGFRGLIFGVVGEGGPGGKSGFRLEGVAKSMRITQKSSKMGSRGGPGRTLSGRWRSASHFSDFFSIFSIFLDSGFILGSPKGVQN